MHLSASTMSARFTALLAVDNLMGADHDVWAVNADESYHEAAEVGE